MKIKQATTLVTKLLKLQMNRERRVIASDDPPPDNAQTEMLVNLNPVRVESMISVIADALMRMEPDNFAKFAGQSVDYVIYTWSDIKHEVQGTAYTDGVITDQVMLDENHNITLKTGLKK